MMRKFGAALAISVLLVTAGCGGSDSGGGDRPSTDEIAKALKGDAGDLLSLPSTLDDKAVDCIAKAIEDSKLSDKTVRALIKADKDYKGSKGDEAAIAGLSTDIGKCVTA
jgi:hypothetical protein